MIRHCALSQLLLFLIPFVLSADLWTTSNSSFAEEGLPSLEDDELSFHNYRIKSVSQIERMLQYNGTSSTDYYQTADTNSTSLVNETASNFTDSTGNATDSNSTDSINTESSASVSSDAPTGAPAPFEPYGPFVSEDMYLVLFGIDVIPDSDEWASVTQEYLNTFFFEDTRGRTEDVEITIEFVKRLGTGGQTEALYVQTTSYKTDSDDVLLDEFTMGPWFLDENRAKYVQMLKDSDSTGYGGLTDTSVAEQIIGVDSTSIPSNETSAEEEESNNNTAMYIGIGVGGAVILICCCCICLCLTGVITWGMMGGKPKLDDMDNLDDIESDDDLL